MNADSASGTEVRPWFSYSSSPQLLTHVKPYFSRVGSYKYNEPYI